MKSKLRWPKNRMLICLLAALLIHLVPWLILPFLDVPARPATPQDVQVLIIERPAGNKAFNSAPRPQPSAKSKTDGRNKDQRTPETDLAFDRLKLKPTHQGTMPIYNHGDADQRHPDDPAAEWGQGGGEFGRIADFLYLEKIHLRLENMLIYPPVLARHKVAGTVKARLVVNESGHCNWHHTQIDSSSRHLRIYILSLLQDFCKTNLLLISRQRQQMNIDLSFQFALTESALDLRETEQFITGNVLAFYRNAPSSKLEWRFGPFKGMFPFPAVNVDFMWLKENWDRYVEGTEPLDPYEPEGGV